MTTIVIVDDSDAVRALWYSALIRINGLTLIAACARVASAISSIRQAPPDVVLLDLQLCDGSGLEVMKIVRDEYPLTKVVMVSNFADPLVREHCKVAGAIAFFDKSHEMYALAKFLRGLIHADDAQSPTHLSHLVMTEDAGEVNEGLRVVGDQDPQLCC